MRIQASCLFPVPVAAASFSSFLLVGVLALGLVLSRGLAGRSLRPGLSVRSGGLIGLGSGGRPGRALAVAVLGLAAAAVWLAGAALLVLGAGAFA